MTLFNKIVAELHPPSGYKIRDSSGVAGGDRDMYRFRRKGGTRIPKG